MEVNNYDYPQHIIDMLSEGVFSRINGFLTEFLPRINSEVRALSKMIENDPRSIYSVIVKVKNKYTISVSRGYKYNYLLTSIYTILYYLHRDEPIYKARVFSPLIINMGYLSNDGILKSIIQAEVDKFIEVDKLCENTPDPMVTTEGTSSVEKYEREINRLRRLLNEYVGEDVADNKKPYFSTSQLTIAFYFLADAANIRILDNQSGWAKIISKMSRRSCQNIREILGKINTDMEQFKNDATVVAKALDNIYPGIATKIRNNFEIVATT